MRSLKKANRDTERRLIKWLVGVWVIGVGLTGSLCGDSYDTLLHRYEKQIQDQQSQLSNLRVNLQEKNLEAQRWQEKAESAKAQWVQAGQSVTQAQVQVKQVQQQENKIHALLDAAQWSAAQGEVIGREAHRVMSYMVCEWYKSQRTKPWLGYEWTMPVIQRSVIVRLNALSEMTAQQTMQAKQQASRLRSDEAHWQSLEHQRLQDAETWRENQERSWSRWQMALRRKQALEEEKAELEQSEEALQVMLENLQSHRDQTLAERQHAQELKTPSVLAIPRGSLPWPVIGTVTQRFGRQYSTDLKQLLVSNGIKIKGLPGQTVRCIQAGHVLFSNSFREYGQLVIVQHAAGLTSVYAGLKSASVHENQTVGALEPVGVLGDSGSFYFELRHEEEPIDPLVWLASLPRSGAHSN